MATDNSFGRNLKAARNALKWSQDKLAAEAGIVKSYISELERGVKPVPPWKTIERLAASLQTSPQALLPSDGATASVGVWGNIGAGAAVFPMSDYSSDPMYEIDLPPTVDPAKQYVGFEIEGFSMPPALPGYIVIFRRAEFSPIDVINSPCMVDTADGRRLWKVLRKGYSPDRYNLESWDGSPLIEDVEVTAALPFAAMTPGRNAR